jgi:hypothetical protein
MASNFAAPVQSWRQELKALEFMMSFLRTLKRFSMVLVLLTGILLLRPITANAALYCVCFSGCLSSNPGDPFRFGFTVQHCGVVKFFGCVGFSPACGGTWSKNTGIDPFTFNTTNGGKDFTGHGTACLVPGCTAVMVLSPTSFFIHRCADAFFCPTHCSTNNSPGCHFFGNDCISSVSTTNQQGFSNYQLNGGGSVEIASGTFSIKPATSAPEVDSDNAVLPLAVVVLGLLTLQRRRQVRPAA